MEKKTDNYDNNFYSRVEKIRHFRPEIKTLYLKDNISSDNIDFKYLCTYYKFYICKSLFDSI